MVKHKLYIVILGCILAFSTTLVAQQYASINDVNPQQQTINAKPIVNDSISEGNTFTEQEVANSLPNPRMARSIEIQDHTIIGPAGMRIYNLAGQDVTLLNGRLPSGLYIVKTGKTALKVRIE